MVTGQQIVDAARQLRGAPYRMWGWGDPIPMWLNDGQGDPPPASWLMQSGVECSDLINYALEINGLPPGYGTEAFYNYLIDYEPFDPAKAMPAGAIAFSPYSGPALADQGHIAVYTGQGTQLIQAITLGVTEDYDAATTYSWGGSTAFSYMARLPGVTYADKPQPQPSRGTPFTVDHLLAVYSDHLTREDAEKYFPPMLAAFKEFEINSRERIAAFLGQAAGEVNEFDYWEEIGHGDGRFGQFWGRGPMGLTWEDNYRRATEAYQAAHPEDPQDFVANPDLVATPKYGFWTSAWFWRHGPAVDLNTLADSGDFEDIMYYCYGDYIVGASHDFRVSYYDWGLSKLPLDLTLDDTPQPEEDIVYDKYVLVASASAGEDVAYADAAKMVLDAAGIGNQVFDEDANREAVANAAMEGGGPVCIIVGPKAAEGIPKDNSPNFFRVYVDKADEPEAVSTLRGMREVLLPWFEESHEVKLVDRFDAILMALDPKYSDLIARSEQDGPKPQPPPSPPAPVVNWAGFGKDGVLRMGGDWSDGYIVWPDPTKNARPYWVEYIADREENKE